MHPKHRVLLKKNAKKINTDFQRAFYYVEDSGDPEQQILHIDWKIIAPAKLGNVKKVNRTLEVFKDKEYKVSDKARMCAGTVTRDDAGLVFEVQIKKGLGSGQLARSLKAFKKLIGQAKVSKGDQDPEDAEELADPGTLLTRVEETIRAYQASSLLTAGATQRFESAKEEEKARLKGELDERYKAEERVVEKALRTLAKFGESAAKAGQSKPQIDGKVVLGKALSVWRAELEAWEAKLIDKLEPEDQALLKELDAAMQEALGDANLSPDRRASASQAQDALSTFLLQQQQLFRRKDTQIDGVLSPDELFFTRGSDAPVALTEELLRQLGLDKTFTLQGGALKVKDGVLTKEGITPDARKKMAAALMSAVGKGYDLHVRNPNSKDGGASMDLHAQDALVQQRVEHKRKASATNLKFDRQDEVVPGSKPPQTFREAMAAMNHATDPAAFNAMNEMLSDAFELEKSEGKVDGKMTFLQYKLQFVDLEVPAVDESGLRWHDGSGTLNAAEWSFLQLRVKDLPKKTQHNYYVRISSPYLKKGSFERKLDLGVAPPALPTSDDIYKGLAADGFWADYAGGKDLVAYYKKDAKITVELGYVDDQRKLTWTPTAEAFYTGKVTGQDEVLPMVDAIPGGVLKTLLTDADGQAKDPKTGQPLDIGADEAGARKKAVDAISGTVMNAALTTWAENSGEAITDLLKPIPDTQKVFLRQSNGTVNAIRIGNDAVRTHLKTLSDDPRTAKLAGDLHGLLTQFPYDKKATQAICKKIADLLKKDWEDAQRKRQANTLTVEQLEQHRLKLKALSDANNAIGKCSFTDIGQTKVITEGNDTGAFGKCAPTSYFCGTMCGIATHAYDGLEAMKKGPPEVKAEAAKLEALLKGAPLDEDKRKAIDAQLKACSDQIKAVYDAQRDKASQALQQTPDWANILKKYKDQADAIIADQKKGKLSKQKAQQRLLALNQAQKKELQGLYDVRMTPLEDERKRQMRALDGARQLKESVVDRMVVKNDAEGPYFDMTFPIPREAFQGDPSWLESRYGKPLPNLPAKHPDLFAIDPKTGWVVTKTKVRPGDIQEYLEETNRDDKYRGEKKHMMDFFKDPSSMNNIQLMQSLGPGLIAVGLDKGLKQIGKDSGLLYGPDPSSVATMVMGHEQVRNDESLSQPMPKKGTKEYKEEFERRRGSLLGKLKDAQDHNGGISVSMGFKSANGHVNYIQSWGTPSIDGVEISADDVARCRMNLAENPDGTSAWQNDKVQPYLINTGAMARGLESIGSALTKAGKVDKAREVDALRQQAKAATDEADKIVLKMARAWGIQDHIRDIDPPGAVTQEKLVARRQELLSGYFARLAELKAELLKQGKTDKEAEDEAADTAWNELKDKDRTLINLWGNVTEDPGYAACIDKVRKCAADTAAFLKDSMQVKHDGGMNPENVVLVSSNTERDNAVTDSEEDRERVGGGNIGSQKRGSANATDATYFVPLNAMASGWNGTVQGDWSDDTTRCSATRYNYSDDARDQFVMLAGLTTMVDVH